MIGYRLCKVKTARHPFYVESISTNLYTIEELCYFLYHNPFLIDRTVLNASLTHWLAEELDLQETALVMERAMRGKAGLAECVLPVFLSIQYLSAAELRRYRQVLDTLGSVPYAQRLKRKGDALAQNGKYAEAVRIYRQAMSEDTDNRAFQSVVWYNIGFVEMQLFEYEEGAAAFLAAWKQKPDEGYALTYLEALRLTLPDEKYRKQAEEFLEEAGLSEDTSKRVDDVIAAAREKADVKIKLEQDAENRSGTDPEQQLAGIAKAYHAAAGM